jgi:hypothetical protein
MKLYLILIFTCLLFFVNKTKAQVFDVDTLQYQGNSEKIVNFVILGDGYTAPQMEQFVADARRFKEYLFSQSPYSHYRQYFNVFVIKVPSLESGVKHSHTAPDCPEDKKADSVSNLNNNTGAGKIVPVSDPNNYFGSRFDNNGLHRLVVATNQQAVRDVLAANFPNYTQTIILANSPYYGGSGGVFPTATVNKASNDIAIHELGHSFASLADEYWPGLQFLAENTNRSQNASPDEVSWKKWIGTNGIGVYSYGGTAPNSVWFRPHEFCKMQYLIAPFCSVCGETIIERIHALTSPIVTARPDTVMPLNIDSVKILRVRLAKPDPNTLKIEWYLNGRPIASNIDSISINPGLFTVGQNRVEVTVTDTTDMVRIDKHSSHHYGTHWVIENNASKMLAAPSVRWGDSIQTCYGSATALSVNHPQAGLTYNWYTDSKEKRPVYSGTNFTTGPVYEETTFYLEGEWQRQKTERVPVTIKVLPGIQAPEHISIEQVSQADTVNISVTDPDPNLNYRWYESADDIKPITSSRNMPHPKFKIERGGVVLKVPLSATTVTYYVEAVSKTTSCASERKKVEVKAIKLESGTANE